jgi:hypothetical protein
MYVCTVTLITIHVLNNLLAQKWPPMVSESAVYAEQKLLNTKRNHISVECNMGYQALKLTI